MRIEWSSEAQEELWSIIDYIDDRNPQAARKLHREIEEVVLTLPLNPLMYRLGKVDNTREIVVHPNYLVVYRVIGHIEVLSVIHAKREYP
ncbi:type II toxin-antitoxin system RelE/ParE family toxin [Serratia sp. BW106]|uniref:type II toxin-antitoxin system RelE/ParE family toxin n=1 Tax=Serratia TaxID=613 RepID=UPI000BFFAA1C|nr:type II toxin-antitoxin system RelE/ParE family toxin [Serratia sp. BW106]